MEQLQSLIAKYWDGSATTEEKKQLLQLLETDEMQLKIWLKGIYEKDLKEETRLLSGERSLQLWQQIQAAREPVPRRVTMPKQWLWQAAAVLLLAGAGIAGWIFLKNNRHSTTPSLAMEQSAKQLKQVANTGSIAKEVLLEDSSLISLEPNSTIAYYEPRNISLAGKALFKVAGDPDKPFTVYANGVATTALGTQFTVSTLQQQVAVRLLEGKVVVRTTDMKDVYLVPGQELTINVAEKRSKVVNMADSGLSNKDQSSAANELVFRQAPLQQVFHQLSIRYKVKIESNEADIKGLVFTGTFATTDSLQNILSVIASLNNLSIQQQEEKIIIKK